MLRPINDDVLLKKAAKQSHESATIFVPNDQETDKIIFEVMAIGPKVTDVKVGDLVIAPWTHVTDPFDVDGSPMGITAQEEILGVLEDD